MYIGTSEWRDLESGHLYQAGDPFPYDGQTVSDERITALSTAQNKAGLALIKAVEEPDSGIVKEEAKPAEIAEKTVEKADSEKKPTTARKPRATKAK